MGDDQPPASAHYRGHEQCRRGLGGTRLLANFEAYSHLRYKDRSSQYSISFPHSRAS
jgi:hypothetical protein